VTVETTSIGREFARRVNNIACELQLQTGIHHRIERFMEDFAVEHPNLRASYIAREVDESYFQDGFCPPEAAARPALHALCIEGENLYEFVLFAHGFRRDVVDIRSIAQIQETWLEPEKEKPFIFRATLYYTYPSITILRASTGESQDAAQEFLSRLRYLKGW
jgi:hypothetical protein